MNWPRWFMIVITVSVVSAVAHWSGLYTFFVTLAVFLACIFWQEFIAVVDEAYEGSEKQKQDRDKNGR